MTVNDKENSEETAGSEPGDVVDLSVETDEEVKVSGDTLSVVVDGADAVDVFKAVENSELITVTAHNADGDAVEVASEVPLAEAAEALYDHAIEGMSDEEVKGTLPSIEIEVSNVEGT